MSYYQKNIILFLLLATIIGIAFYSWSQRSTIEKMNTDIQEGIDSTNTTSPPPTNNIDPEKNIIPAQPKTVTECSPSSPNFVCQNITQGMEFLEPNYVPPEVCGCRPTCPDGQAVIVSQGSGFWPDGSHKGVFVCSAEYPA